MSHQLTLVAAAISLTALFSADVFANNDLNTAQDAFNHQATVQNVNPTANRQARRFSVQTYQNSNGQETIQQVTPTQPAYQVQVKHPHPTQTQNFEQGLTPQVPNSNGVPADRAITNAPNLNNQGVVNAPAPLNKVNPNQVVLRATIPQEAAPAVPAVPAAPQETLPQTAMPQAINNNFATSTAPLAPSTNVNSNDLIAPEYANNIVTNSQGEVVGADGSQIPPQDINQSMEVTVNILTTLDDAILEGFKSLESSLTLGLNHNAQFDLEDIAPSVRGLKYDSEGNAIISYSIPIAQRIIEQHGAQAWQGLSNPVLVWMVGVDEANGNQQAMISGQNLNSFAQSFLNSAPDYSYRLIFPILDLEDIQKVKARTITNNEYESLVDASKRYGADYFIAASVEQSPTDNTVTLKWNLYNREGAAISQSSMTGMLDEVASLSAGDIARALMTYQKTLTEPMEASNLTSHNVDISMLGAGDGFVRLKIANVRTLQDIQNMRKAFVTYGYDGDTRILGYDNGLMVLEIITNSDPNILVETMRRAGDFNYIAPWTFSLNSTTGARPTLSTPVSKATYNRPNSIIDIARAEQNRVVVKRDKRDVGIGEGLPNRNAPAIQGAYY